MAELESVSLWHPDNLETHPSTVQGAPIPLGGPFMVVGRLLGRDLDDSVGRAAEASTRLLPVKTPTSACPGPLRRMAFAAKLAATWGARPVCASNHTCTLSAVSRAQRRSPPAR